LAGEEDYRSRSNILFPCIAELAACVNEEALWRPLNYQILKLTKSENSIVRAMAARALLGLFARIGAPYLTLLPETLQYLSELMEDDDAEVLNAKNDLVQEIERISGSTIKHLMTLS